MNQEQFGTRFEEAEASFRLSGLDPTLLSRGGNLSGCLLVVAEQHLCPGRPGNETGEAVES